MSEQTVVLELARLEAAHLAGLVAQFRELLQESARDDRDPALSRLAPDAYDDADAAREFRDLTRGDLLDRRAADAELVLASLSGAADLPEDPEDPALLEQIAIPLDGEAARAWMRTLAAVRLVLATRLGIAEADDHDPEDPRFGIYDWIGYRLDVLVGALDRMA
jgi:hypothetical protein